MSALVATSSELFDRFVDPNAYEPAVLRVDKDHSLSVGSTTNIAGNVQENTGIYSSSALPQDTSQVLSNSPPSYEVAPQQINNSNMNIPACHPIASGHSTSFPTQLPPTHYSYTHDLQTEASGSTQDPYHRTPSWTGSWPYGMSYQQLLPIYNIKAENVYVQQNLNSATSNSAAFPSFFGHPPSAQLDYHLSPQAPSPPLPFPFSSSMAYSHPSNTEYPILPAMPQHQLLGARGGASQFKMKSHRSYAGRAGQPYAARSNDEKKPDDLDLAAELQGHFYLVQDENAGLFHGPSYQCGWGNCHESFGRESFEEGLRGSLAFQETISKHIAAHIGPLSRKQKNKWPKLEKESGLRETQGSKFKCLWRNCGEPERKGNTVKDRHRHFKHHLGRQWRVTCSKCPAAFSRTDLVSKHIGEKHSIA